MSKRIGLKNRTLENDIRFKGFLSYRHLRIIAWVCMVLAQISTILTLNGKVNPDFVLSAEKWQSVLTFFAALPVPLFLLANFSNILRNKNNYKAIFKIYGLGALGLYLAGNFVVFHFGYRFMKSFMGEYSWGETARLFGRLLPSLGSVGYTFNIFIDLLLCTLLFFFMNYEPKKVFTGKKVIIFRLLVILPIVAEVAGIIIKYLLVSNKLAIPSYVFFLLPSKPPLIFLAFVAIVFALKIGAATFKKRHPGEEALYQEHISTNAHSLKTSIIISTIFLVMAILDFVVMIVIMMRAYVMACAATEVEEEIELLATSEFNSWLSIGFGGAVSLLPVIPIVMFFDYKKEHQNKKVDSLLPLIGIGLIAIVYIEGIFEIVINNLPNIIEKIKEIFSMFM